MNTALEKKIQVLERNLTEVKQNSYQDVLECEESLRYWRNKYFELKESYETNNPDYESKTNKVNL